MKIFIIARGYPSKRNPVWGCFEKDQAEALRNLGHHVTILSVDSRFRFYWRKLGISKIAENAITSYTIFLIPDVLLFFLPKTIRNRFYAWQLELLYRHVISQEGSPDILYSHYLRTTQRAVRIHEKYHIPLVGIEHWSEMGFNPISKKNLSIAQNTYPKLDQLITVSTALRNNILTQIGIDSIVIPNIISNEFCYNGAPIGREKIKIATIGRLVPEKRFDKLLMALSKVSLPWELSIIGTGKISTDLESLARSLNIIQNVKFLGSKSKHDIVEILQHSHFFVLPSKSETFGVVYIEALACGLPIIATDCGGPSDIVTSENGLLVPVDDIEDLSNAILYMAENIDKYDRKAISEDCKARFSAEIIAKRLTQIFEDTIKKAKNNQQFA